MISGHTVDADALYQTRNLVTYLAELADQRSRYSTRDILDGSASAPVKVLWLDDVPVDLRSDDDPDLLIRMEPVPHVPPPAVPEELSDWIDPVEVRKAGAVPRLRLPAGGELDVEETEKLLEARRPAYVRWLSLWRPWADAEPDRRRRRDMYELLEHVVKTMEQLDDEFEFVLGVGWLTWQAEDISTIRRHLLVEKVDAQLSRSGTATVRRIAGSMRLEDQEVLGGLAAYRPDRARPQKEALLDQPVALDSEELTEKLSAWVGLAVETMSEWDTAGVLSTTVDEVPRLSQAPALLLRPRTKVLIAEAYRGIAEALQDDEAPIPVGLAQLVVETDHEMRESWLTSQGAVRGDVLGRDPLFPLPSNEEQSRVMELLRTETGIVVQGPPGTGKTHTIANLISALLARGQRVLVTSQKDQALRVLREKIPAPLRELCVLLAGGSRDAAVELRQGIDALSSAIASTDEKTLRKEASALEAERVRLLQQMTIANERVQELRSVERRIWQTVVPEHEQYSGTLADIVRQTQAEGAENGWMPALPADAPRVPPLSDQEFRELVTLIGSGSPERELLFGRMMPPAEALPTVGDLSRLFETERNSEVEPIQDRHQLLMEVSDRDLAGIEARWKDCDRLLRSTPIMATPWAHRAADDLTAGRRIDLWSGLFEVAQGARTLLSDLNNGAQSTVDVFEPVSVETLAATQRRIVVGDALLAFLRQGGKLRKRLPTKVQREAEFLLESIHVDGGRIQSAEQLEIALARLRAEVASIRLAERWSEVGVPFSIASLRPRLAELADHADMLRAVFELHSYIGTVRGLLVDSGVSFSGLVDFMGLASGLPSVRAARIAAETRRRVEAIIHHLDGLIAQDICARELDVFKAAVQERDLTACETALLNLRRVREQHAAERRCRELEDRLAAVHPALIAELRGAPIADAPIGKLSAAWAWALASNFVSSQRTADEERRLVKHYADIATRVGQVTEELVAVEARRACLVRLTDEHTRALNSYREHMSKIGAGTGKKTAEFRRAAQAAMEKAQDAVPAWVVPLGNLLENLPAQRDRFDVVIVDEASQVGIEHLYLLWMAPRVIVVGDDKQCTPSTSALGTLDEVFERMRDRLSDLPEDVRGNLTPKSNLYGVLTARSGKNGLVRLREHFRCVPEIIRWSSDQFYAYGSGTGGLIPLRERRAEDLVPLKVTRVEGGLIEGTRSNRRNPVEAKELVETLIQCLRDPAYEDKTFGIVVLASSATGHVKYLEHLINESVAPEERQRREIRVGTAPNFQGDERDVVFLSTVGVGRQHLTRSEMYQQAYNVAVSRAKDQLWLITSLGLEDLDPADLRSSLIGYMNNPPSVYGQSPDLETVSESQQTKPFESMFEQQVFRQIRSKGYHVVPQFPVGSRRLDLVIAGAGGRVAVECDGHYWHAGYDQQISDARRDSELERMGWITIRIRESEFAFDSERELAPLWRVLDDRGISPHDLDGGLSPAWTPVDLPTGDPAL